MVQPNDSDAKTYAQERKYRRFDLKYPVRVKFQSGNGTAELDAVSRNVSLGGLLLDTPSQIPPQTPVTFVLTLRGGRSVRPVELAGEGKVVRVQPGALGMGFGVAIECKRPITQIERYLPAGNPVEGRVLLSRSGLS